jgi:tRNA(Ile)-lysidine synthase
VTMEPGPVKRGRPSLARQARALMEREGLFPPGCRALVMVSGGQDSLALIHVLTGGSAGRSGPASVRALHVNHHLRGEESEADEALVRRVCVQLGVELTVVHRSVDKAAGNVQESARAARREAALQVAEEQGCTRIALGHTADDQVETMLYRLGRYGGLAAFRSMRPSDVPWVRPLLNCRRADTGAYCRDHVLEFADDRGNAYPGYARTGIREEVLPAWEAALPGAVESAARAAEVAAEIEEVLRGVLLKAGTDLGHPDMAEASAMNVPRLSRLSAPLRRLLLHRWLEGRAPAIASRAAVLAVEALLAVPGSAERALGGGWYARKEYDRVRLEQGLVKPAPVPGPVVLAVPGEVEWGAWRIAAERVDHFFAPDPAREAYMDGRLLKGPLAVRGPQQGDRVRPLGAPGGRKLQDLFVDLRVPAAERSLRPLVVCCDRIVWVCGMVVADEGRIGRDTTDIVRFSLSAPAESVASQEADGSQTNEEQGEVAET